MGKQHTAAAGKPNFQSFQKGKKREKGKTKTHPNSVRQVPAPAKVEKTGRSRDGMVALQAPHSWGCKCVTCLIALADTENAARIASNQRGFSRSRYSRY